MRTRSAAVLLALGLLLGAGGAGADWLVLRNGSRVETRGAWTQKGKLIVFTATNGSLASVRADEVDLEASVATTSEAKAPPPPPEPPKKAVVVLTDADFPRTTRITDENLSRAANGEAPSGEEKLVVAGWQHVEVGEGIEITGTLRNPTRNTAANAMLTVIVADGAGRQIGRAPASLSTTAIPPGETVEFSVPFPEIAEFGAVTFEADAVFFLTAGAEPGAGEGGGADAAPVDETASPNDGPVGDDQDASSPNDELPADDMGEPEEPIGEPGD